MSKRIKHTYNLVKIYVENLGYELISKEYKNNSTKLILKDKLGYYYTINLNNLRLGKTPEKFHKYNPYTIQNIKLWCKLNNKSFELLSDIYIDATKKLIWKCLKEKCGEEFKMNWANIQSGQGCSVCVGRQVVLSNCLAINNPKLASEWHPTLNGDLTPYDVTCGSNKSFWWKCDKGHEWPATIVNRNNDENNCPYCSGKLPTKENNLLVCNPELCKEWDYERNDKNPEDYLPNSNDKVWWQCSKNPKHKWPSIISSRNFKNYGCPYCSGRYASEDYNLLIINPELCEEWDYSKNDKRPEDYTPNSGSYAWWKCKECGHEWYVKIVDRNRGRGCPECNKSKGEKEIEKVLGDNNWIKIDQKDFNKLSEIDKINNIYYIPQKEFDGLLGLKNGNLSYDFYIPKLNLLIEFHGEQHEKYIKGFHKSYEEFEKQVEHDRRKLKYANINNINLLIIWYYDFDNIKEILEKELNIIIDNLTT